MQLSYKKPTTKKETYLETWSTGKWECTQFLRIFSRLFVAGTILPPSVKNIFRDDLVKNDLEIVGNKIKTEEKKVRVVNTYVPPNSEGHNLEKVFESLKNDSIILLGDFVARKTF